MKLFTRRTNVIDLREDDGVDVVGFMASNDIHEVERDVVRDVQRWYDGASLPVFGAPTRCPDCGNYGMTDRVDEARGIARHSCHVCGARWTLTKRALGSLSRSEARITCSQPLGTGILIQELLDHDERTAG